MGNLFNNYEEACAIILFGIGFTTLLLNRNMIKKIIGFSMMDNAIYLFLAANCGSNGAYRFTGQEAAQLMIDHGCTMAYNMDGGQTAEVILGGQLMNLPEFHMERQVSDVLCFASALPEGGAA